MNRLKFPDITESRLYFTLYFLISAATFRHSMEGFASIEGSTAWGALSALAVDALMILFAHSLRRKFTWTMLLAMFIPAVASVYTQWLFAVSEAQLVTIAPGAEWLGQWAINIANIRVVLLPALLPVSALVAALVGENEQTPTVSIDAHNAIKVQLETLRNESAKLRIDALSNKDELEKLREFHKGVTDPTAWKSATSAAQLINGVIFTNGNRPETKVLAKLLNVKPPAITAAMRKKEAKTTQEP